MCSRISRDVSVFLIVIPYCRRSFVAFGERQRILGVAAKNQAVTNLKNSIFNFKRYLGRQYDDPSVQEDINRVPFKMVRLDGGGVGIKAMYLNEERVYTPEQLTAMLFTKLRETAENAIQAKIHDCVISVSFSRSAVIVTGVLPNLKTCWDTNADLHFSCAYETY